MAVSEVSVCNSALAKVGSDRITSLDDDTKAALILEELFPQIRDEVLRSHPWNFARKKVELTADATPPEFRYDYRYALPADCLRVLRTEYDDVDWEVENDRYLLTDEEAVKIEYIARVEDPTLWDAIFCETLAWRLAQTLAYPLTQSLALVESCRNSFKESLSYARSINGQEGTVKALVVDSWANVRY